MFKLISNIPIFRRLFIAFAIATLIPGVIIVILSGLYFNSLNVRGQAVQTSFDAQNTASQQLINLQRMNAELQTRFNQIFAGLGHVIHDPSLNASGALINIDILAREIDFDQAKTMYQNDFDLASSDNMSTIRSILLSDNPENGNKIINDQKVAISAVVNQLWDKYKNLQDTEIKQLQALQDTLEQNKPITTAQIDRDYATAYETLFQANTAFTDLRNSWQSVVDSAVSMGKAVTAVGSSETEPFLISTGIALLCAILVVLITGYTISITITRPLRQLASLTKRIAKGETHIRVKAVGRDEIYLVASAMNNMLDNIVRLIQETQAERDSLQKQVEKLVNEVSGVGEGDLSVQAEVTADALGVLADSFNYMVEELGSLVVRVKMVAHEVDNSTKMILYRMVQLVNGADSQIEHMTEAAVEVEQMASSSRQVAERAEVLYTVARGARYNAAGGREAVQQTVEGMGRIYDNVQATSEKVQVLGEHSREINNIVEVISTIAYQTNRLALDAAIQAAMAGENGKGFGAVASDIRRLAERSKDQVSMIARIVRSVREDINAVAASMVDTEREASDGTKLVQEAGASFELIFTAIEHQAREIENINRMAMQQLQSSSEIVQIIREVSDSTQQSSTSTREGSQSMQRLALLVEQLRSSVEAFKLRAELDYYGSYPQVHITQQRQNGQQTISRGSNPLNANSQLVGAGAVNTLPPPRSMAGGPSYPALPSFQPDVSQSAPSTQAAQARPVPPTPVYPQNPARLGARPTIPPYPQQTPPRLGARPPFSLTPLYPQNAAQRGSIPPPPSPSDVPNVPPTPSEPPQKPQARTIPPRPASSEHNGNGSQPQGTHGRP